jgi:hypothetical protein
MTELIIVLVALVVAQFIGVVILGYLRGELNPQKKSEA